MNILRPVLAIIPSLVLFSVSFYFIVLPPAYDVEKNVIGVYEPAGNYQGALFFLKNYLVVSDTTQPYPLDLAFQVFALFAGLYIVALPLIFAGFFGDNVLDSWTATCLIGSFGALVIPFFALDFWYRWMLMLAYPFTFYAVNGISKVLQSSHKNAKSNLRHVRKMKLWGKAMKLVLILPFSLSLVFVATAMQGDAVPLSDVDDTMRAMQWLDTRMDDDSVVLTQIAFLNWARLYLDERHTIVRFRDDFEGATNTASRYGFSDIFFVWWNESAGCRELAIPDCFVSVFESGRIVVFSQTSSQVDEC